jgi:hypothetical protein
LGVGMSRKRYTGFVKVLGLIFSLVDGTCSRQEV